jgi:hypothetical protein
MPTDDDVRYRAERGEHGDLPGVYTLNCPTCWPRASVVWVDAEGNVLGSPCGCSPSDLERALVAPEAERQEIALRVAQSRETQVFEAWLRHPLARAVKEAEGTGYQRGFREGLSVGRHGVTRPPDAPPALAEIGSRARQAPRGTTVRERFANGR